MFPLGKTGGLIEAPVIGAIVRFCAPLFPLGKTGGLIEASHLFLLLFPGCLSFPLGKTGGLIEAVPASRSDDVIRRRVSAG